MARLARSLETLRRQIDTKFPKRSKASDGWIGDPAHQARFSQHNPNDAGVVCAIDITHDPANGVDCARLMEELDRSNDDRIFYLIHNGEIDNSDDSRTAYTGPNPHIKHLHISVIYTQPSKYDDARAWELPMLSAQQPRSTWREISMGQATELYTHGAQVTRDQRDLIESGFSVGSSGADGYAGPDTIEAIKSAQKAGGLTVDGAMGARTRSMLHSVPAWGSFSIAAVQRRLVQHGYKLVVDGRMGPNTKAAITGFQKRMGLTADGVVGPMTWTALYTR